MCLEFFPSITPDDTVAAARPLWTTRSLTYQLGDEHQSKGWYDDRWERQLVIPHSGPTRIFEQARARLINFDFLPSLLVQFTAQWNVESRLPKIGDVVFQRTHLVRLDRPWVDVLSATHISDVVDEAKHFTLRYITTKGHPECGTASYQVIQENDAVYFRIHAISKPALWTTRLVKPIITRPLQIRITKGILDGMMTAVLLDLTDESSQP